MTCPPIRRFSRSIFAHVLLLAALVGVLTFMAAWRPIRASFLPLDPVPLDNPRAWDWTAPFDEDAAPRAAYREGRSLLLRAQGTPEEIGRAHGTLLGESIRLMLKEYVEEGVFRGDAARRDALLDAVLEMRPALPEWYLRELAACAEAAGVDEDVLLLAQCEGDVQSLPGMGGAWGPSPGDACSAFVAFGSATHDGRMVAGRNFDYWAGPFYRRAALAMYVVPAPGDGYPFVSVGWAGVLGGWTFVNSQGLIVANHLGGGSAKNPRAVPTLIMNRILAQKAGTVDEAVDILRRTPRMRGQIIWLAQPGDAATGRPPRAVAVEYDAEQVFVREAEEGLLVVTNTNFAFGAPEGRPLPPPSSPWSPYVRLKRAAGRLSEGPLRAIAATAMRGFTLHSAEIFPEQARMDVAFFGPFDEAAFEGYELFK